MRLVLRDLRVVGRVARLGRQREDLVARRHDVDQICGLDDLGRGTYTAEGIIAITEMLKLNSSLLSIRLALGIIVLVF